MNFFLAALLIGVGSQVAAAQSICFPAVTLLDKGKPKGAYSKTLQATLTPSVRGNEVYLPLRFVGLFLGRNVSVDPGWNTFTVDGTTYRLGEKESHYPVPTIGGVDSTAAETYDVAPFLESGRIYVPLKMFPGLAQSARKSWDGTVRLIAPEGCPATP